MSARDELYNELRQWCSKTEVEWITAALDAYRVEILREAAETIRRHYDVKDKPCKAPSGYVNPAVVANLIDPEVKS